MAISLRAEMQAWRAQVCPRCYAAATSAREWAHHQPTGGDADLADAGLHRQLQCRYQHTRLGPLRGDGRLPAGGDAGLAGAGLHHSLQCRHQRMRIGPCGKMALMLLAETQGRRWELAFNSLLELQALKVDAFMLAKVAPSARAKRAWLDQWPSACWLICTSRR